MRIEESGQKINQELSLLDPTLDLFEKVEEGIKFYKSSATTIPGGKLVDIAHLLILKT